MNENRQIGIIGSGLIGVSFALALRQNSPADVLLVYDDNADHAYQAKNLGAFDSIEDSPVSLAEQCDILLIATPVSATSSIFKQLAKANNNQLIITDTGSVKRQVIDNACQGFGLNPAHFIPGHPLAGNEKNGPLNASAALFKDCRVLLTPLENNEQNSIDLVSSLWKTAGASVVEIMSPEQHDKLLADISHLPHIAAYALLDCLLVQGEADLSYAAGGLRDFTRIAESDPIMWRDIFLSNSDCVLKSITYLEQSLANMRGMIEEERHQELTELLRRVQQLRKSNPNSA